MTLDQITANTLLARGVKSARAKSPRTFETPEPSPLHPAVVAILLVGFEVKSSALSAKDVATKAAVRPLLARDGLHTVAQLWRQHEAVLRAEADRLRIRPFYKHKGKPVFFAELVAERTAIAQAHRAAIARACRTVEARARENR